MLSFSWVSLGLSLGFWPCPEPAVPSGTNRCSLTDVLSQPPRWASPAHGCPPSSRPTNPHHGGESRDRAAVCLAWCRPGTQPAERPSDPTPVHRSHGHQPQLGGVFQKMLRRLATLPRLLKWPAPDRVLNGASPKALNHWNARSQGLLKREQGKWTQLKA